MAGSSRYRRAGLDREHRTRPTQGTPDTNPELVGATIPPPDLTEELADLRQRGTGDDGVAPAIETLTHSVGEMLVVPLFRDKPDSDKPST